MGKYEPLELYLSAAKFGSYRFSFAELEKILGFELPPSARKYQAWWANQQSGPQSDSWLMAGFLASDLALVGN